MIKITNAQRSALVADARWLKSWGAQIGYGQQRPFPVRSRTALTKLFDAGGREDGWDCSAFTIECFYLAGLIDPSGYEYEGLGNTESMLANLKHYTNPADAHPGALVIFGADLALAEQHACMVTVAGKNPTLISHGSPGVKELTLTQEQSAHDGQTVFLDVTPLG